MLMPKPRFTTLEELLDAHQREMLASLTSPAAIQAYLDATPYSPEERDRCPLNVLADRVAHCLDGGLFAAMALRRLGHPPLVVDLLPDPGMDDDHVLAIFKQHGCYGAVAKSNFVGLRYREPVYRSLRELVMSYFEVFYNVDAAKTLRAYTPALNLGQFDRFGWEVDDAGIPPIVKRMAEIRRYPVVTAEMIAGLARVDELSYRAGMLATNPAGLYKPKVRADG